MQRGEACAVHMTKHRVRYYIITALLTTSKVELGGFNFRTESGTDQD